MTSPQSLVQYLGPPGAPPVIGGGTRPLYSCPHCPYSSNSDLAIHICPRMFPAAPPRGARPSRFVGERTFKCSFCPSAFYQRSHLASHLLTHTGQKPFKCDVCEQAFSRKSSMLRHRETQHLPPLPPALG